MEYREIKNTDLVEVLRDLELIVVALAKIGSNFHSDNIKAALALNLFFTEKDVFKKLANARYLLSEPFSEELGEDDMDELERCMFSVEHWKVPDSHTTKKDYSLLLKRIFKKMKNN